MAVRRSNAIHKIIGHRIAFLWWLNLAWFAVTVFQNVPGDVCGDVARASGVMLA